MGEKLERYILNAPKPLRAGFNPVITAFLEALATSDEDIVTQIQNTKDQLFVATASGTWLDRLASSVGVSRPTSLGMSDSDFQKLIPNLSLKPKQIRKIFYDTMDVFWGPLFSRANLTSINYAPFNVSPSDTISILFDTEFREQIKVFPGEIATPGAATVEELVAILGRLKHGTASVILDQTTGNEYINIRTNAPGPRGTVQILASSMVGGLKLNFDLNPVDVLMLSQRTIVYEITPRELILEIPAAVPTLRKDLKGTHHFHQDSTIEGPILPNNGIWEGSFFFSPSSGFTVTGASSRIQEVLQEGQVYTKVTVDDATKIPDAPGFLVFNYGMENEEFPVPYLGKSNNNTVLINAAHVFQNNHGINSFINVLSADIHGYEPNINGQDLAIYMASPVNDRTIVQKLLETLTAAGIVITFKILLPSYKYLIINPYSYYNSLGP